MNESNFATNDAVAPALTAMPQVRPKARSGLVREFAELWRFRYVTYSYVYTTVKIRYRRSYLGFVWTVLAPMFHYIMIGFMMGLLMKGRMENFYTYYFTGAVFYALVGAVIAKSPSVMLSNEHYIKKIYVPKVIFLLNVVCYEFTNFFLSASALVLLGQLAGVWNFSILSPLALVSLFLSSFFLIGIAAILSVLTVYFRDLLHIVPVILQAVFFVTPIAYRIDMIPPEYHWLAIVNPIFYFLELFRMPIVEGQIPPLKYYAIASGLAAISCVTGLWVLKKFENKIVFKL